MNSSSLNLVIVKKTFNISGIMEKQVRGRYIYPILVITSILILWINSKIQNVEAAALGEYYYSKLLRTNYTYITGSLFLITGFVVGFLCKIIPLMVGLSMISVFLLATFYEMTVFKGSHNLLPFELMIYCLFALPPIVGTYLGLYFKKVKQKP